MLPLLLAATVAHAQTTLFSIPTRDATFPSGFRLGVASDDSAPVLGLELVLDAGSSGDPGGQEGLAHLVEHLAFRARLSDGTPIGRRLDALGCTSNAFTSFDEVHFVAACPSDAAGWLYGIASQWLTDPLRGVEEADFAVERSVVTAELNLREHTGDVDWLTGLLHEVAPAHVYGRPIGGTPATVAGLTLDDARRFVSWYYRPDRASLAVVGDIPPDHAFRRAFLAFPPTVFHPEGRPGLLKKWIVDGQDVWWLVDPHDPSVRMDTPAPKRRPVHEVEVTAHPTGRLELELPASLDVDPTPGFVVLLPPVDRWKDGFDPDEPVRLIRAVAATKIGDAGEVSCGGESLRSLLAVTCAVTANGTRDPEALADTALAALPKTTGQIAQSWDALPVRTLRGLAAGLDTLGVAADVQDSRLQVLAEALHRGNVGSMVLRWFEVGAADHFARVAGWLDEELPYASTIRVRFVPRPVRLGELGSAVAPSPGLAAMPDGSPIAPRPLANADDVSSTKLSNGTVVIAVRRGHVPAVHVGVYASLPPWVPTAAGVVAVQGSKLGSLLADGTLIASRTVLASELPSAIEELATAVDDAPTSAESWARGAKARTSALRPSSTPADRARDAWQRALVRDLGLPPVRTSLWPVDVVAALNGLPRKTADALLTGAWSPAARVVVVAGPVDPVEAVGQVREVFSLHATVARAPEVALPPPSPPRRSVLALVDPDLGLARVSTHCAVPVDGRRSALAAQLLGVIAQDAAERRFRVERGLAYDPSGGVAPWADRVWLWVGATVPRDRVGEAVIEQRGVLADVVASLRRTDVLEAAKTSWARHLLVETQGPDALAEFVGRTTLAGVPPSAWIDPASVVAGTPVEALVGLVDACARSTVVTLTGPGPEIGPTVLKAYAELGDAAPAFEFFR